MEINPVLEHRPEVRLLRAARRLTQMGKAEFTEFELAVQERQLRLGQLEMSNATLYRALAKLKEQRRITARESNGPRRSRDNPPTIYYRLRQEAKYR